MLVSAHCIVPPMLVTGASFGMLMMSIPWLVGVSEWLHLHPHARLLHAACQGKLFLSHILLRSRVLVTCLQDATMAIALHNRNALSTCVPVRDAIGCQGPSMDDSLSASVELPSSVNGVCQSHWHTHCQRVDTRKVSCLLVMKSQPGEQLRVIPFFW